MSEIESNDCGDEIHDLSQNPLAFCNPVRQIRAKTYTGSTRVEEREDRSWTQRWRRIDTLPQKRKTIYPLSRSFRLAIGRDEMTFHLSRPAIPYATWKWKLRTQLYSRRVDRIPRQRRHRRRLRRWCDVTNGCIFSRRLIAKLL